MRRSSRQHYLDVPGSRIAIVGGGPTAIYVLKYLLEGEAGGIAEISLYEAGPVAGVGTPYDPRFNSRNMLANIASIEIPPVTRTLLEWIRSLTPEQRAQWGIEGSAMHERHFFPRVILGAYYADELAELVARARARQVRIRVNSPVTDIAATPDAVTVTIAGERPHTASFDFVVIATGHRAPRPPRDGWTPRRAYGRAGESGAASTLGILGSSLSAIDVAMAHAVNFGSFHENGDRLEFRYSPGEAGRTITMMSRSGVLPEADFYCPIPYQALEIFTPAAAARCVRGQPGDLDRLFDLVRLQLEASDPAFAAALGLRDASADDFADRYFAARLAHDPFESAARNLNETRCNKRCRRTVAWRYALLRMHEVFGKQVRHLAESDILRFEKGLRRCFVDNYAACPPLSVARMLALHAAGVLSLEKLGTRYSVDYDDKRRRWAVTSAASRREFDDLVDARGPAALAPGQFPFPTLRRQIKAGNPAASRDLGVGDDFALESRGHFLSRVYCLSLPFLVRRNPFLPGLTSSRDMGEAVAESIQARIQTQLTARDSREAAPSSLIAAHHRIPERTWT